MWTDFRPSVNISDSYCPITEQLRNAMNENLSPLSLTACAMLFSADLPLNREALALLLEITQEDLEPALRGLFTQGFVREDTEGHLLCTERVSRTKLRELIGENDFPEGHGFAEAVTAFFSRNFHKFGKTALEELRKLDGGRDIARLRYVYGVTATLLAEINLDNASNADMAEYLSYAIKVQEVMQMYPWNVDVAMRLYNRMREVAERCGDKRSLCWIDLAIGTLNINIFYVKNAIENHTAMKEGIRLLNELGDSSIITVSSGMVCLYHFLEGEFTKAINCGYSYLYQEEENTNLNFKRQLFSYVGLSAISLGEYDVAVNILSQVIQKTEDAGTGMDVNGLRAILAYAFIKQGEDEKGLEIIDDLLGMNSPATMTYAPLVAVRVLAYYHCTHGRVRQAYAVLRKWTPVTGPHDIVHNNCIAVPFVLEMLCTFHLEGLSPLYRGSIFEEIEAALNLPSKVLHAVAWRVLATVKAHEMGLTATQVLEAAEKSMDILRGLHAPEEKIKTLALLARILIAHNRRDDARVCAAEAWSIHSGNRALPWPEELDALVKEETARPIAQTPQISSVLVGILQSMRQQYTWENTTEFFNSILCSFLTVFNLTRGALFSCDKSPSLQVAVDMDEHYFKPEDKKRQRRVFEHAMEERRTVWRKLEMPDGSGGAALALYIGTEGMGSYVLYMEGNFRPALLPLLGDELFTLLENFCITEITLYLRHAENWKEQFKNTPMPVQPLSESAGLYFHSPEMVDLVQRVDRLALKDTTILILGESGVGKEMIARRLHERSGRTGNFIAVNIASTPEDLFESEFYGHEKGSFTGANYQKRGLFELADKGTLFIDEVGDIPPFLQVKLLRVLQEHRFMRVGGTRSITSNFRLVAATNRNLEEAVRKGTFREDLYYRLSVVPVHVPPLRERPEDILFLAQAFLQAYASRDPSRVRHFTPEVEHSMLHYSWPGNVRELKNFVERYSLMPDQATLYGPSAPKSPSSPQQKYDILPEQPVTLAELQDRYFEKLYLELNGTVGGKKGLASVLGISRTTAYAWIERLQLKEKYEKRLITR